MRDLVLGPLGGDEPGHRYRPIASLTQRATERLRTSRCIRSSTFSLPQPLQLGPLVLAQRRVAVLPAASLPSAPVTQRALVDPQLPGHLRDRLAGLEHQPHRALPESPDQTSGTAWPSLLLKAMSPRYEGKPRLVPVNEFLEFLFGGSKVQAGSSQRKVTSLGRKHCNQPTHAPLVIEASHAGVDVLPDLAQNLQLVLSAPFINEIVLSTINRVQRDGQREEAESCACDLRPVDEALWQVRHSVPPVHRCTIVPAGSRLAASSTSRDEAASVRRNPDYWLAATRGAAQPTGRAGPSGGNLFRIDLERDLERHGLERNWSRDQPTGRSQQDRR